MADYGKLIRKMNNLSRDHKEALQLLELWQMEALRACTELQFLRIELNYFKDKVLEQYKSHKQQKGVANV